MRNLSVSSSCRAEIHFAPALFCHLWMNPLSSSSQVTTRLLMRMATVNASGSGDLSFSWIWVMAATSLFPPCLVSLP